MNAALSLLDLRKSFGPVQIIRGVSLDIAEGERHAIIGPNGAGKSTLFNLVSGRIRPSSGEVRLHGQPITGLSPFEINRRGLSRSFQITNIFPKMSVEENLRCAALWSLGYKYAFWTSIDRLSDVCERAEWLMERVGLTARRHVPAGVLSYAEQRALEIGVTIGGSADVVLLDEPTAGMNNSETEQAVALIRKVTEGKTLVMVEHDMGVVFSLADRISVLVYGQIIASDTPERIRENPAVREAYLGRGRRLMRAPLLEVESLEAYYGKSHILHGVTFHVGEGEIVGLLGRNGVGRSTTIKAIMGDVPPRGSIRFRGEEIAGLKPHQTALKGLGYVPETRDIFPGLTVRQNLQLGEKAGKTGGRWAMADMFRMFPQLEERADMRAGVLSGGEQQMLTICRTLMGDPDLIMIDEPTEGLSPMMVEHVGRLLEEIARRGVAILLIEQKLTIALRIAHRLYVMGHGKIVYEGSSAELAAAVDIRKEWLEV